MRSQMFGKVVDPFRQQSDLHFGRTGVFLIASNLGVYLLFRFPKSSKSALRA
jgi:hypothetical protein